MNVVKLFFAVRCNTMSVNSLKMGIALKYVAAN